jgi:hypothetical protein
MAGFEEESAVALDSERTRNMDGMISWLMKVVGSMFTGGVQIRQLAEMQGPTNPRSRPQKSQKLISDQDVLQS